MNWEDIYSSEEEEDELVDQYDLLYEVEDNRDEIIEELIYEQNCQLQMEKAEFIESKIIKGKCPIAIPSIPISVNGTKVTFGKLRAKNQQYLLYESNLVILSTNEKFNDLYNLIFYSGLFSYGGKHMAYFALMLCVAYSGKTVDLFDAKADHPTIEMLLRPPITS